MIRLESASEFAQTPSAPMGESFAHLPHEGSLSYAFRLAQDPNYPDAAILEQVADRLASVLCR